MRQAFLVGAALAALSTSAMGMGCPDPGHIVAGAYDPARRELPLGLTGFNRGWKLWPDGFTPSAAIYATSTDFRLKNVAPNRRITFHYAGIVKLEDRPGKRNISCSYRASDSAGTEWAFTLDLVAKVSRLGNAWASAGGFDYCNGAANACQFKIH